MPTSATSPCAARVEAARAITRPGELTRRVHLRAAGVSLLLEVTGGRTPAVLHWGRDLGPLTAASVEQVAAATISPVPNNAPDVPVRVGILPQLADGWLGTPGIIGSRDDGSGFSPLLVATSVDLGGEVLAEEFAEAGAAVVGIELEDIPNRLAVRLEVEMLGSGLLRTRARLTNTAAQRYTLDTLTLLLPVPLEATELLDFAGRWVKERTPQRRAFTTGTHLRENRRGRTGPDAAHVLHAGTDGFSFRTGEVWAVHTAFSGNHRHLAERTSSGAQLIGGGELLLSGEGRLEAGEDYTSPWVYGSYAAEGLDEIAARFHRYLRSRPHHVDARRPVTVNVWEAVYFDHDLARLRDLADRAADLGIERFVLDDGWFGARRDDTAGLGDWVVSPDAWPDGLGPLIDHVRGLGMQFGLWFEPEMVNEDSDVARAHPEWIMAPSPDRRPLESRHQQVLNLTIPEAWQHVFDQMHALLDQYEISYLKWDHNRDLIEAATSATGAAATHAQTLAAYRLLAALKQSHPGLEIESCSSGGARVDLGVLQLTDRVWVSDCIDPLERQQMNRWTAQLIPLELMGSHIASGASHTTGRLHTLGFRAASALFGHLGVEWDLARASAQELDELRAWIALHKRHRELLFTGDYVRADRGEDSLWVYGVLASDAEQALFEVACVRTSDNAPTGRIRLPGLIRDRRYRVRPLGIGEGTSGLPGARWPVWARRDAAAADEHILRTAPGEELTEGIELPGSVLVDVGLAAPLLQPESALLLEVTAIDA